MRKKIFLISIVVLVALFAFGCGDSANVKQTNYASLLSGTFVYSGPVPGAGPLTLTLVLDSANRSFTYKEAGNISNRTYKGSYAILGNQVLFTSQRNEVSKHTVTATGNGFKLSCISNEKPITFGLQPLEGNTIEYYKQ